MYYNASEFIRRLSVILVKSIYKEMHRFRSSYNYTNIKLGYNERRIVKKHTEQYSYTYKIYANSADVTVTEFVILWSKPQKWVQNIVQKEIQSRYVETFL